MKSEYRYYQLIVEDVESRVTIIEVKIGSESNHQNIRKGDIIETIGRRIIKDDSDYLDMINQYKIGDTIMMRIVDVLYGIPFIILIILLMVIFGRNLVLLFMAIGAVEWLTMSRIVRSQVMNLSKQEFVLAAEAMGVKKLGIISNHLIPNAIGPVIVYATLTVPQIMLLEAFLSFLGLGVQAPMSSWGILIRDGAVSMEEYWWLLVFPSLIFSLTLFSLNFIGDGLRDALDPRTGP